MNFQKKKTTSDIKVRKFVTFDHYSNSCASGDLKFWCILSIPFHRFRTHLFPLFSCFRSCVPQRSVDTQVDIIHVAFELKKFHSMLFLLSIWYHRTASLSMKNANDNVDGSWKVLNFNFLFRVQSS